MCYCLLKVWKMSIKRVQFQSENSDIFALLYFPNDFLNRFSFVSLSRTYLFVRVIFLSHLLHCFYSVSLYITITVKTILWLRSGIRKSSIRDNIFWYGKITRAAAVHIKSCWRQTTLIFVMFRVQSESFVRIMLIKSKSCYCESIKELSWYFNTMTSFVIVMIKKNSPSFLCGFAWYNIRINKKKSPEKTDVMDLSIIQHLL